MSDVYKEKKPYIVFWEGPYQFSEYEKLKTKRGHVLYQLYGTHPIYGSNVLLYIGLSGLDGRNDIKKRFEDHDNWVVDEYDDMTVRLGSIGIYNDKDWMEWEKLPDEAYEKPSESTIKNIEALLIYAHQPAYNQKSKGSTKSAKGIRIFNAGKMGQLLQELSYLYFVGVD